MPVTQPSRAVDMGSGTGYARQASPRDRLGGTTAMTQDNRLRTFDGAVAIVTGAASGIGRALAESLARRGAHVVLADRQAELAEEVAAAIRTSGGRAAAADLDVTDFPATERLVRQTAESHGRLDYLFNNAGV